MRQSYQDNKQFYLDENEIWEFVPHYPNYKVSNMGRVYSYVRDKIMTRDDHNGVTLYNNYKSIHISIQSLMACTFLGLDITDPCRNRVLFRDGNSNNLVLNNIYIEDTSDLPGEIWKPLIKAANRTLKDFYKISNKGRIKSKKHYVKFENNGSTIKKPCPELIISPVKQEDGYLMAYLGCKDGSDVNAQIHRLVAAAFCPNDDPENKTTVNHIDGNTSNNCASNLEWCTQAENAQHAIRTGLKGNWAGRKLRYTVLHVEEDKIYNSLSDVDRALGRSIGYCAEHLEYGRPITDVNGTVWTLEVFKDIKRKINSEGQHCTIDEFPGKEFISLGEASLAIGRWEGYISDALKRGGVIRNKAGQTMHVHLIGDAPVVSANEVRAQKKAAGLLPEKKKPNYLSKSNVHRPLKHVETGTIYKSFSEAARAMGRGDGYVGECFAFNRPFVDKDGKEWTFELLEEGSVTLHYKKNPCYIDEIPGKEFANLAEACEAIGRNGTYISDRIAAKKPVTSKDGQLIHFHYSDPEKEAKLQSKYYAVVDLANVDTKPKKNIFNIDP